MLPVKINSPKSVLVLGDDDFTTQPTNTKNQVVEMNYKEVIEDINIFSKSTSMKKLTDELKIRKRISKFIKKTNSILTTIDTVIEDKKTKEIFNYVLQTAEDYLYIADKQKCNKIKYETCMNLLKRFINDDKLRDEILHMQLEKIKKSSLYRRNKISLNKAFFFVLKMLRKAI